MSKQTCWNNASFRGASRRYLTVAHDHVIGRLTREYHVNESCVSARAFGTCVLGTCFSGSRNTHLWRYHRYHNTWPFTDLKVKDKCVLHSITRGTRVGINDSNIVSVAILIEDPQMVYQRVVNRTPPPTKYSALFTCAVNFKQEGRHQIWFQNYL